MVVDRHNLIHSFDNGDENDVFADALADTADVVDAVLADHQTVTMVPMNLRERLDVLYHFA